MDNSLKKFSQIMVFYIVLSYVLMPYLFYHFGGKKLKNAGMGFVGGSILSIILWFTYGQKMINK